MKWFLVILLLGGSCFATPTNRFPSKPKRVTKLVKLVWIEKSTLYILRGELELETIRYSFWINTLNRIEQVDPDDTNLLGEEWEMVRFRLKQDGWKIYEISVPPK